MAGFRSVIICLVLNNFRRRPYYSISKLILCIDGIILIYKSKLHRNNGIKTTHYYDILINNL